MQVIDQGALGAPAVGMFALQVQRPVTAGRDADATAGAVGPNEKFQGRTFFHGWMMTFSKRPALA